MDNSDARAGSQRTLGHWWIFLRSFATSGILRKITISDFNVLIIDTQIYTSWRGLKTWLSLRRKRATKRDPRFFNIAHLCFLRSVSVFLRLSVKHFRFV